MELKEHRKSGIHAIYSFSYAQKVDQMNLWQKSLLFLYTYDPNTS